MQDLFAAEECETVLPLAPGASLLRGLALSWADALLAHLQTLIAQSPWRFFETPGGRPFSVATSNCGALGWLSDRRGYRYDAIDPRTGHPWPVMPAAFRQFAETAAARAGFEGFAPDACLMNRYVPGARLSLHQDHDEHDMRHPIVSVSLGLPATFLFGGTQRSDPVRRIALTHGDVVVWGGPSRMAFHGVQPLPAGTHPATGDHRINLTFRRAG